jgi:hypothetical protein
LITLELSALEPSEADAVDIPKWARGVGFYGLPDDGYVTVRRRRRKHARNEVGLYLSTMVAGNLGSPKIFESLHGSGTDRFERKRR